MAKIRVHGIDEPVPCVPSCRVTLALLQFLGCITLYLLRFNISVAIVCMTTNTTDTNDVGNATCIPDVTVTPTADVITAAGTTSYINNTEVSQSPPPIELYATNQQGEFDWDRDVRGLIQSSFFIGYLMTMIPAGFLVSRISTKWSIFCGMLVMTLATFLSPPAARFSPYMLVTMQIIKGLGCGVYYPGILHLWSFWAPPDERSKLTAFAMSGAAFGSVLTFALSGLLCASDIAGGWPSVFYVYGLVGVVWLLFWALFVFDTPAKHPRISPVEQRYIQASLGTTEHADKKSPKVPWVPFLTSLPFWAIVSADFAYQWGWYTALTSLPQFISDVLHFDIKANGFVNALPYIVAFLAAVVSSFIADALISKRILSVAVTRKIFLTLGLIVPAAFVVGVGQLKSGQNALTVGLLTLAVGLFGCVRSGHIPNQLDIAPRFASVIQGISNSGGAVAGLLAPQAVASLAPNGSKTEWDHVFILFAVLALVGNIIFVIFGQGTVQPWALEGDGILSEEHTSDHEHEHGHEHQNDNSLILNSTERNNAPV